MAKHWNYFFKILFGLEGAGGFSAPLIGIEKKKMNKTNTAQQSLSNNIFVITNQITEERKGIYLVFYAQCPLRTCFPQLSSLCLLNVRLFTIPVIPCSAIYLHTLIRQVTRCLPLSTLHSILSFECQILQAFFSSLCVQEISTIS